MRATAFGPARTSVRSQPLSVAAVGGARRGLMLWRSACADCTAVLGPRPRRRTRYVRCAHCTRTAAASQLLMHAARADLGPALLVATEIAPSGYRLPRRSGVCSPPNSQRPSKGAGGQPGARLWSAEKHRTRGRARSAHQQPTRRGCQSAVNEVNTASSAPGPRDRASQGSRSAAQTAPAKRVSLPARAFAAPNGTWLSARCESPARGAI